MSTWHEIAERFAALEAPLAGAKLERQWTDDAEEWRLGGRYDLDAARRFRAVAADASPLLEQLTDLPPSVLEAQNENRWFRALWELTGPHAAPVVGLMSMAARKSSGVVSVGRIEEPARRSVALATRFGGTG